jgi:glyoxylase-like metal-dependent hydrolase (beta-lactamase superfamily II)
MNEGNSRINFSVLKLSFSFNGNEDCIYPVILKNKNEVILVDCGYMGFLPLIENAALQNRIDLYSLTGVIITHHDMDHMGGLFELKQKYPFVKVYSSEIEKDYISGKQRSLRLIQAEDLLHFIPDDQKEGAIAFQEMLKQVQPVYVDETISERNASAIMDGLQVIHTPGHMPGHISLYIKESKTLIAADAVVYENGEFDIANPRFTLDLPQALKTVQKLQQLEINEIVCYHGGIVRNNIQQKLNNLLSRYALN